MARVVTSDSRIRRSLQPGERELIEDLLLEIRQMDSQEQSISKLEADLFSLLPEVQCGSEELICPAGHWRWIRVNRTPPYLADIVWELERIAYRFCVVRCSHGFEFDYSYAGLAQTRRLIKCYW